MKVVSSVKTKKILGKVIIIIGACFLRGRIYLNQEKGHHETKKENKQKT